MTGALAPITVPGTRVNGPSFDTTDDAARLFHNHPAGREVPGIEEELPEGLEASFGQIAEVERSGATPSSPSSCFQNPHQLAGMLGEEGFILEWEACPYQGALHTCDVGRLDGASILPSALTSRGPPPFTCGRARNSSYSWDPVDGQRHGRGVHRVAVEEVGRAVQGVHDPGGPLRSVSRGALVVFFCDDLVIGVPPPDDGETSLLGGQVGVRHVVRPAPSPWRP